MTEKFSLKRVVFVLPAVAAGGAERVLITLMNGLDRERYEPVFLSVSDWGELGSLIDPSIERHSLGRSFSPFMLPFLYWTLRGLKPDICLLYTSPSPRDRG